MKQELEFQRILKTKIENLLKVIGCVVIEGPKQSGKTFLGEKLSQSIFYVQEKGLANEIILDVPYAENPIFNGPKPKLIDEWQIIPRIWDKVRFLIDQAKGTNGLFILTGSSKPDYQKIFHNGAGRMAIVNLQTLTFTEIIHDQQKVSLSSLFEQVKLDPITTNYQIEWVAQQLLKGGWPHILKNPVTGHHLLDDYLQIWMRNNFLPSSNLRFNQTIMKKVFHSLSRLNGTQLKKTTVLSDLKQAINIKTLNRYLDYIDAQYLTFNLNIWNLDWNHRSKKQLQTSPKVYLCDPAIGLRILKLKTTEELFLDLNTFGIYFENQVIKDLLVYAQAINAEVFFYRDTNGLEIDAILELDDGNWAAIEIKLGAIQIEQAAKNLLHFSKQMEQFKSKRRQAKFLMIITAGESAYQRADGIYVVPHVCLEP